MIIIITLFFTIFYSKKTIINGDTQAEQY